ncbi:3-deoxy-D-manno-octulosonic acid transferase [Gammaproteobacteria bacterium]
MSLPRRIYSLVLCLLVPLVVARLFLRSLRAPGYRRRMGERFGFGSALPSESQTLWIHAVSVGEVQAAVPFVRALRERYPLAQLLLTTTTPTGAECVYAAFGTDSAVVHRYAPYDLPGAVRRFLDRTQPQLLVIMETELWPNLIRTCRQQGIPVILANARLSERSARGYRHFPTLTRETLQDLSAIAAQADTDAKRLKDLGAPPERLHITGNIKFDLRLPASLREEAATLRRDLDINRPVWIAASTHDGEEEAILTVHRELRRTLPNALLLLVPRHPERFPRVASLCRRMGFPPVAWSEHLPVPAPCAVYLGDTMGRLPLFYAAADAAFVGGSLVPVGGHNPLEPAALGIPVTFGPHRFNFAEITHLLLEAGAAQEVGDVAALVATMTYWLQDANLRHALGECGRQVVDANRGALAALMAVVAECHRDDI